MNPTMFDLIKCEKCAGLKSLNFKLLQAVTFLLCTIAMNSTFAVFDKCLQWDLSVLAEIAHSWGKKRGGSILFCRCFWIFQHLEIKKMYISVISDSSSCITMKAKILFLPLTIQQCIAVQWISVEFLSDAVMRQGCSEPVCAHHREHLYATLQSQFSLLK